MKKDRISCRLFALMACMALMTVSGAYGAPTVGKELRQEVEDTLDKMESDSPELMDLVAEMKKAGASYLPEIMAPAAIENYQKDEKQRLIAGVYLADLSYAFVFGVNKNILDYGLAVSSLMDQQGFPMPKLDQSFQQALNQEGGSEADERFQEIRNILSEDKSWKEKIGSVKGLHVVADSLYAWVIESVHLVSEMTAQSNYDPKFLEILGDHTSYLKSYSALADKVDTNPELAALLETRNRRNTIGKVLTALSAEKGIGQKEVEEVRKIVGKERERIVK